MPVFPHSKGTKAKHQYERLPSTARLVFLLLLLLLLLRALCWLCGSVGSNTKRCSQHANQVQLLQSLDHRNIIRYFDFFLEGGGEADNKLVIVFEW